jgi:leader peptidase (prepilin peptidase)/N-methyltransferase
VPIVAAVGYHSPVLVAGIDTVAAVIASAAAGAAWGIVLPGLVDRYAVEWPDGEPKPDWRRSCGRCGADRPRWWLSSGRCPSCGRRPTPSRWVTVPLSAVVWSAVAAAVGPSAALPAFLLLAAIAVPLALVDVKVLRLPDPLVAAAFVGGLLLLALAAVVTGRVEALPRALIAAALCGLLYGLLALFPRAGLGFGDVKLAAVLGLYLGWLGWFPVVAGVLLTPLVNLPLVVGLLVTRRAGLRTAMPYGPAILTAAVLAIVISALRSG